MTNRRLSRIIFALKLFGCGKGSQNVCKIPFWCSLHRKLPFFHFLVMTNSSVGRSRTVTVVYQFCMKNRLSKILLLDLVPEKGQVVNFKNPDLGLIWRIHLESRFYGCMIRFGISPKIKHQQKKQTKQKKPRKIRFRIQILKQNTF